MTIKKVKRGSRVMQVAKKKVAKKKAETKKARIPKGLKANVFYDMCDWKDNFSGETIERLTKAAHAAMGNKYKVYDDFYTGGDDNIIVFAPPGLQKLEPKDQGLFNPGIGATLFTLTACGIPGTQECAEEHVCFKNGKVWVKLAGRNAGRKAKKVFKDLRLATKDKWMTAEEGVKVADALMQEDEELAAELLEIWS